MTLYMYMQCNTRSLSSCPGTQINTNQSVVGLHYCRKQCSLSLATCTLGSSNSYCVIYTTESSPGVTVASQVPEGGEVAWQCASDPPSVVD
eukprot:SAG22_NODE_13825_length_393_cov_1.482993_2_plen_90_part_01